MGLLSDFGEFVKTPEGQGLLSAVVGGMAGARQGTPWNNVGRAGLAGLSGYGSAIDRQDKLAQEAEAKRLRDMQVQSAQMQIDEMKRKQDDLAWQRDAAKRFAIPGIPAVDAVPQEPVNVQNDQGPNLYSTSRSNMSTAGSAAVPAKPADFDWKGYIGEMYQRDPMEALKLAQSLKPQTIKLGAGEAMYDQSGKKLFDNPKNNELPSAIQEYNLAVQQGEKRNFTDWLTAQKQAGATKVSVPVSMDKGFGDAFATDAAKDLGASRDAARAAANNVTTLNRISQVVSGGKVALGPTSTFETFGRQIGETLGVGGKNNAEVLANTRKVIQGAANLAADGAAMLAKQGQITDGERLLISRAAGGDIDKMTAPEVNSLIGVLTKINTNKVQAHNDRLGKVDAKFAPFVPFYRVDMGTQNDQQPTKPSGVVDFNSLPH